MDHPTVLKPDVITNIASQLNHAQLNSLRGVYYHMNSIKDTDGCTKDYNETEIQSYRIVSFKGMEELPNL
jgi:hypothetical protein